jgi:hypothetical protein
MIELVSDNSNTSSITPPLLKKIHEILVHPISVFRWNPQPAMIDPKLFLGQLKKGDKLMLPTGLPRHTVRYEVKGGDWYWEVTHTGYWAGHTMQTIIVKDTFRGEVPVWFMDLYWRFGDKYIKDAVIAEDIWTLPIWSERSRIDKVRSTGQFQPMSDAFSKKLHNRTLMYKPWWRGNEQAFNGYEKILYKKEVIWSSQFQGGLIVPIS